ncbi:MAG TPA: hypothetical protein VLL52_05650 [Anaerolineae bacterium]|nr:hypothetical protein [Anaerolineae bacterium]
MPRRIARCLRLAVIWRLGASFLGERSLESLVRQLGAGVVVVVGSSFLRVEVRRVVVLGVVAGGVFLVERLVVLGVVLLVLLLVERLVVFLVEEEDELVFERLVLEDERVLRRGRGLSEVVFLVVFLLEVVEPVVFLRAITVNHPQCEW